MLIRLGIGLALHLGGKLIGVKLTRRQFLGATAALLAAGLVVWLKREDIADSIFGEGTGDDAEAILVATEADAEAVRRSGLAGPQPVITYGDGFESPISARAYEDNGGDTWSRLSADENRAATEAALTDIDELDPVTAPDQVIEIRHSQHGPSRSH